MSTTPNFPPESLERDSGVPSVVEHVHLPLQSGDDEVLRRMRRPYNRREYMALVDRIRKTIPGVTADDGHYRGLSQRFNQFEHTLELVREVRFDNAFMFAYSARQGTAAAKLPDGWAKTPPLQPFASTDRYTEHHHRREQLCPA